jgi:spermidine synthase
MTWLLYLIFFLSGAAALLFETLWFHQAGLALGNSVWASSLVLAGFMGGLALGNGLSGALGHRLQRPLRAYPRSPPSSRRSWPPSSTCPGC